MTGICRTTNRYSNDQFVLIKLPAFENIFRLFWCIITVKDFNHISVIHPCSCQHAALCIQRIRFLRFILILPGSTICIIYNTVDCLIRLLCGYLNINNIVDCLCRCRNCFRVTGYYIICRTINENRFRNFCNILKRNIFTGKTNPVGGCLYNLFSPLLFVLNRKFCSSNGRFRELYCMILCSCRITEHCISIKIHTSRVRRIFNLHTISKLDPVFIQSIRIIPGNLVLCRVIISWSLTAVNLNVTDQFNITSQRVRNSGLDLLTDLI